MLATGYRNNLQPLNFIKDYFGEKLGFYFAWLVHFTGWLIPPMIVVIIITLAMLFQGMKVDKAELEFFNSPLAFFYGIFMMIWVTLFNESWVRKQNSIADKWLVRGFEDITTETNTFKSETVIDPDTAHKVKVALKSAFKRQIFVGGVTTLIFITLIILSQIMLQALTIEFSENEEDQPFFWKYIPAFINATLIGIFG